MPSSASASQPRNINHLDKPLSLSLFLAASQPLNPLGLMTGSVLLMQPSKMLFSSMGAEAQIRRKQIWFSTFLKTESNYYIWAKLDYSNVSSEEAKACGHRPWQGWR